MITESPIRLSADAPARNSGGACMTSEQVELLIAVRVGLAAHAPRALAALNFCTREENLRRRRCRSWASQSDLALDAPARASRCTMSAAPHSAMHSSTNPVPQGHAASKPPLTWSEYIWNENGTWNEFKKLRAAQAADAKAQAEGGESLMTIPRGSMSGSTRSTTCWRMDPRGTPAAGVAGRHPRDAHGPRHGNLSGDGLPGVLFGRVFRFDVGG